MVKNYKFLHAAIKNPGEVPGFIYKFKSCFTCPIFSPSV